MIAVSTARTAFAGHTVISSSGCSFLTQQLNLRNPGRI